MGNKELFFFNNSIVTTMREVGFEPWMSHIIHKRGEAMSPSYKALWRTLLKLQQSCKPHHMTYKTKECDKWTSHMQYTAKVSQRC